MSPDEIHDKGADKMIKSFKCERDPNGMNYIDVFIVKDGVEHTFRTLVRTGSTHTIFNAKELNVDISGLKKTEAEVGWETIDVYEVGIDSIAIGSRDEGRIEGVDHIYVSELEGFKKNPLLGCDFLHYMKFEHNPHEGMILELDGLDFGKKDE